MSGKNTAVFGLYPDQAELVEGIDQLKGAGFRMTDLSVLLPENVGSKDIGHERHTKAPEGAIAGGVVGAVIGGALGWLSSMGVTPSIPGAGTLIVSVLTGMGALGTLGAVIGALLGVGRPEYEAKRYEGRMRSGGVLLSVHCDTADWRIRAKNVLRNTGARSIAAASESKADFGRSQKPRPRAQMNGIGHGTLLPVTRPATLSEEPLPSRPVLVDFCDAERRPAD